MRGRLVLLLVLLTACGGLSITNPDTIVPGTALEILAVEETTRFSDISGQRVEGKITVDELWVKCVADPSQKCQAYAWYVGDYGKGAKGRAYFNQDLVNQYDAHAVSWAAAHEVCHSITGAAHDDRHSFCTQVLYGGQKPTSAHRLEGLI